MRYVSTLKDSITGILSGLNLNNVQNLNGAIERGARKLTQLVKIPEAMGRQNITLYDGVYDYLAPTGIFGSSLIDFRPQGIVRNMRDQSYKIYIDKFDMTKAHLGQGTNLTFEYRNGVPIMRVAKSALHVKATLDTCQETTGWTAGGSASGLVIDNTAYYQGVGSLRFNLASSGSQGYIEKTLTVQDLTTYLGVGVVFVAIEMPSTNITNVGIRLGSSSANYYQASNTSGILGAFTSGNFLIVACDLASSTTVGTPDISKIAYLRVYMDYDGTAMSNVRIGGVWASLPSLYEVLFQTAGIFKTSGGTISNSIVNNNDEIILADDTYTIFEHVASWEIAKSVSGGEATNFTEQEKDELFNPINGLITLYRTDHPSQELRSLSNYYE